MVNDDSSIDGRVDQHTLLKEVMNQRTNVNTEISEVQANHATLALLRIKEIEQLSKLLRDSRRAALTAARRSVDIAAIAVSFAEINAQPVIDAIAVLSNVDSLEPHQIIMRMKLIQGLSKVGSQLALDMVDCLGAEAETANADLAALEASAA